MVKPISRIVVFLLGLSTRRYFSFMISDASIKILSCNLSFKDIIDLLSKFTPNFFHLRSIFSTSPNLIIIGTSEPLNFDFDIRVFIIIELDLYNSCILSIWNKPLASINEDALIPANDASEATSPIELDEDWLSRTKVVLA